MILIYTVFPNKPEAMEITQKIVEKRLAACVNIFRIDSIYRWQGKVEKGQEYAAIIKTIPKQYRKVEQFIKKNHSYQVPCILELPVGKVTAKYRKWLGECLETV